MTIEKQIHSGALVLSELVRGQLVSRVYMGYSQREALARFKRELRNQKGE